MNPEQFIDESLILVLYAIGGAIVLLICSGLVNLYRKFRNANAQTRRLL